jgi:hypothetical protein
VKILLKKDDVRTLFMAPPQMKGSLNGEGFVIPD